MKSVALGEVLEFAGSATRIARPADEIFVTLRINGRGAVRRKIKDGKVPVAFTGYRIKSGQFIYSRIDARNGAFALVPPDLDGAVVSKDFPVFDIKSERVDTRYLIHFFRAGSLQRRIRASSFGATNRQRITEERFQSFRIPLPALDEQSRIAEILDHADATRLEGAQQRRSLDELRHQLYAASTQSTCPKTVGELVTSGALLVHKDGNHGSLYPRAEEFCDVGVPFITAKSIRDDGSIDASRIDHLNPDKAAKLKIGWLRRNDVLLSHNASVGKVTVYDGSHGDALIGTSLTCFRPDTSKLNSSFLLASLRSTEFQRQLQHDMAQTTRNQVPITAQRKLSIPWTSIESQREFATKSDRIEQINDLLRIRAGAHDELFSSLQSRAFSGQL